VCVYVWGGVSSEMKRNQPWTSDDGVGIICHFKTRIKKIDNFQ
jgi:hypothetical protein